ncbi:MAG TPA: CPBP family intramembrane glutamic endopeptidase [Terracidiphilus sp.]|nr:CPBP family intramembrane glutamic endopeptidase [Terracidiphilus sp.]
MKASLPVFTCVATLGPFFGCFITHRVESGNWRAVHLLPQRSTGWLWLFIGPILVFTSFFLLFPAFISKGSPTHWHWHPAVLMGLWLPMFNYNLLGGPLFEEFGWRGFLQAHLQKIMPSWIAAICVGIMWAAWHAPLFLVTWSSSSPLIYIVIVTGLATLIACAFNASGGAVVVAILTHSAFNASPRFLPSFLGTTSTREHPPAELLIAFAFLALAVLAVLFTRGRLNAQSKQDTYIAGH